MRLHRMSARRALVAAATALVVVLLVPALASASVDYVSLKSKDVSATADGVVGPGDRVALTVTAHNANAATTAPAVSATITRAVGATIVDGTAALGDIAPDENASNASDDPLIIQLPATPAMACGDVVHLSLRIQAADAGSGTEVSVDVPTGVPGAWTDHPGGAATIGDADSSESSIVLADEGTIRDVRVRVNDLQSPSADDLQFQLVTPDTSAVVLAAHRISGGTQFSGTTFATRGASISTASPPYTGTFLSSELAGVIGSSLAGPWTLRISDTSRGADGTPPSVLSGWTLQTARADCDPQLVARVAASTTVAAPGAAVVFDASDSTSPTVASDNLTYYWTVDGQPFLGGGQQITTSFLERGVHTVAVSVSDGVLPDPVTDQVTVAVTDPPVADFSILPASAPTGTPVIFDAGGSTDPDGSITSYQWDFDGNGTWDLTTASPGTQHAYARSGTYAVRLRVTDDLGARAVTTLPVVVQNRAPTAAFGTPVPAVRGATAHFDAGLSTDPEGSVTTYRWDWNGDGVYEETTSTAGIDHVFVAIGTFAVGLEVTDDEGATASVTRAVRVTDAPQVSLAAGPESGRPGDVITLTASASDPDGAVDGGDLTYAWDLDGEGGFEVADGASPTRQTTFSTFADHLVRVRVRDADGATAVATTTVKIVNNPPSAALEVTPNPAIAGDTVTFDASGSTDADGAIAQYRFDLDGNGVYEVTSGQPTVTRSYPGAAHIPVHVQVIDSDGARRSVGVDLVVQDPRPNPAPAGGGGDTGGTGGAGDGGYGGSSTPKGPFAPTLGGAPIQSLKAALKVGVNVLLKLDRAATMSLRAKVQPAEARRLGLTRARGKKARPVLVGTASVAANGAGETRVTLKLARAVRKKLARARRVALVLDARVDDRAGHVVPLTRVVLLRR